MGPLAGGPSAVRIASLVPSLTELACALGLGPFLVARTGYCIHPAQALAQVPKVGGTKTVNLAKLARLAPTHVLLNVDENRRETADAVLEMGAQPVVTHPTCPEDNLALVAQLIDAFGDLPGVKEKGEALGQQLARALADSELPSRPSQAVLYLIWRDPWMTVARDTYISQMLARIGWMTWPDVIGGDRGAERYPALTGREPELAGMPCVLLSSEPYAFGMEHVAEVQAMCPNARVKLVDGEALSWYGPRALKGLSLLRQWAQE